MIRVEIEDPRLPEWCSQEAVAAVSKSEMVSRVTVEFDVPAQYAASVAVNMLHQANRELANAENPPF